MINKYLQSGIGLGATLALATVGIGSAEAAIVITGQEVGGNVEFSYSGSINLTGFNNLSSANLETRIDPSAPFISLGTGTSDNYFGSFDTSPNNIGLGINILASSATGSFFSVDSFGFDVPFGYTSESFITGTSSYLASTFTELGIDVANGPYIWTLPNGDTVTLQFESTEVPEPLTLLGASAAVAFGAGFKRRKSGNN